MDDLPTAVSTAVIRLGSIEMRVHHLSDGRRVIDAESMADFFTALEDGTLLFSEETGRELAQALLEMGQ